MVSNSRRITLTIWVGSVFPGNKNQNQEERACKMKSRFHYVS